MTSYPFLSSFLSAGGTTSNPPFLSTAGTASYPVLLTARALLYPFPPSGGTTWYGQYDVAPLPALDRDGVVPLPAIGWEDAVPFPGGG